MVLKMIAVYRLFRENKLPAGVKWGCTQTLHSRVAHTTYRLSLLLYCIVLGSSITSDTDLPRPYVQQLTLYW
jgi:hypothetical protein